MASEKPFPKYVDRAYIINLPEQTDRLDSLKAELERLGFNEADIRVPFAPRPETDNGFPSKGVYGNFLSHLSILKEAQKDSLDRVLVLEDDAIFRRNMRTPQGQSELVDDLKAKDWGMWFGGHSLTSELGGARGLVPTTDGFRWAHCYIVNKPALDDLIDYLEETNERPKGDPRGGKMYIDGAFSLFRKFYPQHVCLVSNPPISIQKGVTSNLGEKNWRIRNQLTRNFLFPLRAARDEVWRWTGLRFGA